MTKHNKLAITLVSVALVAAAVLVGRAWGTHSARGSASESAITVSRVAARASATSHNTYDEKFAAMMVPHHTQAIQMAKLAATRAGSRQVKDLAAQIEAAQGPEIDAMSGWLDAWGTAMDQSGAGDMNGMMSDGEMSELGSARGEAFDQQFLTMMIGHHQGAVRMAQTELKHGKNADALALAASISVSQQGQIAQMKSMSRQG